ncbi:MAG: GNAT family N-acetyltransferase [Planctomycetota bacterium]|jgi:RimJ/RimL family protein N-acetyltransferase
MIRIRNIDEHDAAALDEMNRSLDRETSFMMWEPGERKTSAEELAKRIRTMVSHENQNIFVAEDGDRLVGFLFAQGWSARRASRRLYLVIGILKSHWGQGIGTRLFEEMERWARERSIRRLELTVMVNNEAGLALYRKMGFIVEGTKTDSLFVDGSFVDEYHMAKLL